MPITFELMVLSATLALFFGMMFLFGFPRPHHPLFELESFRSASTGGFWVSVTTGRKKETDTLLAYLRELEAGKVAVVEERT